MKHILISIVLLLLFVSGICAGDSSKRTAPLFFVGAIAGCLFLAHLVMVILMAVAGLL